MEEKEERINKGADLKTYQKKVLTLQNVWQDVRLEETSQK